MFKILNKIMKIYLKKLNKNSKLIYPEWTEI